jgi:hypothetical protein
MLLQLLLGTLGCADVLCRRRQVVKTGSRKGEMLTATGGWHSAGGWLLVVQVFGLVNLGCLFYL